MKIGLQIPSFTWPGGADRIAPILARIGQAAEEAGFARPWAMDHFFQIDMIGKAEEPMLEGYSALNYLAAVTKRVRLGTLVSGVIYRYPAILVKTVPSLDVLSRGRAYLGERLEETLQIALQMWSGKVSTYRGKHYQLAETLSSPPPISQPHPPIMIGSAGEKKTLPLVAKYADACNLCAFENLDVLRAKLEVLRRHCDAIGRPYEDIERTAIGSINLGDGGMNTRQVINYCRSVGAAGIQ
ncbi:MAG: LLM class flavin-dependent oxidoreductase, partial [Candidatus Angelobacter sp.]